MAAEREGKGDSEGEVETVGVDSSIAEIIADRLDVKTDFFRLHI